MTAVAGEASAMRAASRASRVLLALLAFAALASRAPAEAKPLPPAVSAPAAATTAAGQPAAVPAPPADAQEARVRLAKAQSPAEYAAMLDSFSSTLSPSDSLALLNQSLPSLASEYRAPLVIRAGDLALLLGLFDQAASSYVDASKLYPAKAAASGSTALSAEAAGLLLRAARCDLAAGDSDKALELSSGLILASAEPEISAASRLVGAWALALQGRQAEARSIAASALDASPRPESKREARFILWLCALAADKAAAAATLAAEFPGSPEALLASGAASAPPLPHWYLGGLPAASLTAEPKPSATARAAAAVAPVAAAQGAAAKPASPVAAAASNATTPPGTTAPQRARRLQVGYFSMEDNARTLKDELASKGFAAAVEVRVRAATSGKAEEKRWIVTVEAGKDMAKTMQALKDAGYEAYIID